MRRPNGAGTIELMKGSRRLPYAVRIPCVDEMGHIKQKYLSYHKSSEEAYIALDEYNAAKRAGVAPKNEYISYTVQDVYDGWSARLYPKLERDGRTSSLKSHIAAWNKRISQYAGLKMRETTLDQWQAILDRDEDVGKSQSLINNDAILIRALYAYSMERDIVAKDYSEFLDIPSVDPKNPKGAFSDIQLAQLRSMADNGFPWADTALMLCYSGWRITEFLTLTPFSYSAKDNTLCWGIKSDAGRNRIVPVHPCIKPYLNRWIAKGGDTIICDETGHPITSWKYREELFKPIAKALGTTEATPHWCRHTFQTRLHAAGVDLLTSKWLMGHSTKKDVTEGYTHATVDVLTNAVRKLA